jgi:hypothetical protein
LKNIEMKGDNLYLCTGELTANVHGPSEKVPVTIDARGDGKHTLIFTPKEEGKFIVVIIPK